jgi:hypothetical protein
VEDHRQLRTCSMIPRRSVREATSVRGRALCDVWRLWPSLPKSAP